MIQRLSQHASRDVERRHVVEGFFTQREQAAAAVGAGRIVAHLEESQARAELVVMAFLDIELKAVPDRFEQSLLEHAQRGFRLSFGGEPPQRARIVDEELRLGIVTRRESDHELVEIERGHHVRRGNRRRLTARLRPRQLRRIAATRPRQQQRPERHEQRSEFRFRPARAAREQRDAAVALAEHVEDPARVAVLAMVEHVSRLECDAFARLHGPTPSPAGPARAHRPPSPRAP
jgi:hypothetical protein